MGKNFESASRALNWCKNQLQGSNIRDVAKKLAGAIILQVLFWLTVSNECNCSSAGAMVESGIMLGGTNWFYGGVSKFVPPLYLPGEVQKDIFVPTSGRYKNVQLKRTNQGAVLVLKHRIDDDKSMCFCLCWELTPPSTLVSTIHWSICVNALKMFETPF
jgi:hypothetical protein